MGGASNGRHKPWAAQAVGGANNGRRKQWAAQAMGGRKLGCCEPRVHPSLVSLCSSYVNQDDVEIKLWICLRGLQDGNEDFLERKGNNLMWWWEMGGATNGRRNQWPGQTMGSTINERR